MRGSRLSVRIAAVAFCFATSILGVLALVSRSAAQSPAAPAMPPAPSSRTLDPLELFAQIMPVFSHPRCANCHGDMDPNSESQYRDHPGGFVRRGESCTETCHVDEPDWTRVAPPHLKFLGLDTKALCLLQQQRVRRDGVSSYLGHLSTDALIGAGFAGLSGGMAETAVKPPMERDEFVEKAADWIQLGAAGCGTWEGTITQTETHEGTYDYPWKDFMPPSTIGVVEEAERVLTLERRRGISTATVTMGGHAEITRVAYIPLDGGVCKTVYQDNSVWTNRTPGPMPAKVDIKIEQDGKYSIRFALPEETTEQVNNDTMTSDCLQLPPSEPMPNTVLSWPQWIFKISCGAPFAQNVAAGNFIDCELFDPETMPRLKGSLTRTIREHEDAAEPQSWLRVSPASGSRVDTHKSIPIKVITTWDFQLVE